MDEAAIEAMFAKQREAMEAELARQREAMEAELREKLRAEFLAQAKAEQEKKDNAAE